MKIITSLLKDFRELFTDDKGRISSKRLMGIVCSLTLCITLYHNSFSEQSVAPSPALVESVALLAFGCLGLTSLDKFIAAKNKGNDTTNNTSSE